MKLCALYISYNVRFTIADYRLADSAIGPPSSPSVSRANCLALHRHHPLGALLFSRHGLQEV
jgi:hypothetical protein